MIPDPDSSAPNPSPTKATDPVTIESLWNQFGDQLRRRARTRLRQYGLSGQAESMDICNDVMADLAKKRHDKPLDCDDVLAYVLRAIDHQVLDTFRTLARQCRDFRRIDAVPVEPNMGVQQESSPSQIAIRREVLERVRAMLNEEDRKALELMLENRDWNEIGEILQMRPDTARMRVRRALQRVREELGLHDATDN